MVTDNNQPLGTCVGPSLELKEAIELLKGEGPEDLQDLVMKLGMEIVRLAESRFHAIRQTDRPQAFGRWFCSGKTQGCLWNIRVVIQNSLMIPKNFPKRSTPRNCLLQNAVMFTLSMPVNARGVQILVHGEDGKKFDPACGVAELCKVGTQMKQAKLL